MIEKKFKPDEITIERQNKEKDSEIRFDITQLKNSKFKNILNYYNDISLSPVEYLLTGLLASLSGAVGKNVFIPITRSIKIYMNIWAVIIGRSTIMRKTTAINLAIEELQRIEIHNFNQYEKELNAYKNELESISRNDAKNELIKPKRNYILFPQDSTIESLSQILANSERGLLNHSEFGSFLLQLNRGYSADAKQFLTNIFDVPESYEVSRATKENTMLTRPYLSILGASTIDWIQEHSNETDLRSGFFARFIYSIRNTPADKPYIPLLKLKELTKKSESYVYTKDIFEFLTGIKEIKELDITPPAGNLHIDYDVESYKELLESENDNELSFKARLLVYALKFAGLIALADKRFLINENDMKDALLITEYYKKNVEKLLNNELVQDEFSRKEERIIELIKRRGGCIYRSDLMNATKIKAKELDEIIKNLSDKELIEIKTEKHQYNKRNVFKYLLIK